MKTLEYLDMTAAMAADTLAQIEEHAKEADYRRENPLDDDVKKLSDEALYGRLAFVYSSVNVLILSALLAYLRQMLTENTPKDDEKKPPVPPFSLEGLG